MVTLVDYNDRNNATLSNEKLRQLVSKVMAETEEEECESKSNVNNVTMDTFCHQSPALTNTQGEIANVTDEKRISSNILAEAIKGFIGLTIQSTINNSEYYNSEEDETESDPNRNPKLAPHTNYRKKRKVTDTDTNNGKSLPKLLIN